MPIQQHQVDELKMLYARHFKKELSDPEAWAVAHRLVNLYRLILQRAHVRGTRER